MQALLLEILLQYVGDQATLRLHSWKRLRTTGMGECLFDIVSWLPVGLVMSTSSEEIEASNGVLVSLVLMESGAPLLFTTLSVVFMPGSASALKFASEVYF